MKTVEELEPFFQTTLLEDLKPLEDRRKRLFGFLVLGTLGLFGALTAVFVLYARYDLDDMVPVSAVMAFGLIVGLGIHFFPKNTIRGYKSIVIPGVLSFLDESYRYAGDRHVPKSQFVGSRLFRREPNDFEGSDLVSGTRGSASLRFSYVDARYDIHAHKASETWTRTKYLFEGIFFVVDFGEKRKGKTIVLPDALEGWLGWFGKKIQALDIRWGRQMKMEDPAFEKRFEVYSDEPDASRRILTSSLMQRLTRFRNEARRDVHLSFVNSRMVVAVSHNKHFLEPSIFRSILRFKPVRQYYEDIVLVLGIMDELTPKRRGQGRDRKDGTADQWTRKGTNLFNASRYPEAVEAYSKAITANPRHATAWFNRGVVHRKTGNQGRAMEDLKAAAKLGHPKARELLKPQEKEQDAAMVTKKGEVIAFCEDVEGNCYWKYKGYAWYQSLNPASIRKVGPVDDFLRQVQAGEIHAVMMDDWLE